jgi:hypothetical protein
MSRIKLSNVSSQFGAPMGRKSYQSDKEASFKFRVQRVRLDRGGYDEGGAYWGIGQPLYIADADPIWIEEEDREIEGPRFYFRANDRDDAKEEVKHKYPNARFFR